MSRTDSTVDGEADGVADEASTATGTETGGESFTGRSMRRVEDHDILTGRAAYVHDDIPDDALHMALVRSMHPHADVVDVDIADAEAHPDCELVLTGEDLQAEYNPMPSGLHGFEEWSLATDRARFVGEPVAAVFATDRYVAEDAADLVDVDYEKREPVVDAMTARGDDVVIHEDVGTNVPDGERLEFGDVDAAFEAADHVVEGSYDWGRISGVPLETAGVVAEYDPESDAFEIDCNIQLHTLVDDTVFETLGYPPEKVELAVPADVGGSFGTKIAIHRYICLAAMGSQQLGGRPIAFVEDRVENLQGGDMHSTDRHYECRIGLDDDGTIRALDFWFVDDFGAFPRYPVNQTLKPLSVLTGAYRVDDVAYEYELALTNKTCQTAYRGFGVPAHLYALESLIDEAALELDLDPTEIRRKNLISPEEMPYSLPSGNAYDSGDFPAAFDRLVDLVDEEERCEGGLLDPDVVERRADDGKFRGTSPTLLVEPGVSGSDWTDRQRSDRDALDDRDPAEAEAAELPEHLRATIHEDGTVEASLATDSSGQGHRTIVAQLLADQLGILPSDVEVSYLDSVDAPTEYGSAASRMAVMLSGAAAGLGERLVERAKRVGAEALDVDPDEVEYRDGGVAYGNRWLDLAELAAHDLDGTTDEPESGDADPDDAASDDRLLACSYDYDHPAVGREEFGEALARKLPVYPTAAFAVNAPIVEVDAATGEVEILKFYSLRDCGTLLNPLIVDGQSLGGLTQGIGAALYEEFGYDDSGQPQAITLFDYLLPSTRNVPEFELVHQETPSPFTETGAKGTGEGGMIDGPAAIASSINAALRAEDVLATTIPATSHRIRRWLRDGEP